MMNLIRDFTNHTLPTAYHLNSVIGMKLVFVFSGIGVVFFFLMPFLKHFDTHNRDDYTCTATLILLLIGCFIGLYNSIHHFNQANIKYNEQITKISKEYPYTLEIDTTNEQKLIILEKQKPSSKEVDNFKDGKKIKTNKDQIIINIDYIVSDDSNDIDSNNDSIQVSILNGYTSNNQSNKFKIYKTGKEDLTLDEH